VARSKIIVITGATSGIGAEIASALCKPGSRLFLVGRNERKLDAMVRKIPRANLAGVALADLSSVVDIRNLLAAVSGALPRVDVLIHAAGEYGWTELGSVEAEGLDALLAVNVRAPYLLTQGLLPLLKRAKGQVIFINSSVVKSPGEGVAAYKATRHALQGLVDSLRQGLNRHGVRVSSLFPGQTATPHMRRIYAKSGKRYRPSVLMSAGDVAQVVVALTELPAGVEITDVHLRSPTPY
jgi:NADP-dependent 3-hydroxy acid dehydrogenase YdfG